eukprot:TRINITY_DN6248_c0_g2_i1.p1 TRINITY_DN6248_c0_g2~~TRINITY_DN6248_c0_g2_i1.p1  ORF type:complete len:595 (-),score=92.36 TRINITY_DN6248_c0_g2_i1:54-1838(-)
MLSLFAFLFVFVHAIGIVEGVDEADTLSPRFRGPLPSRPVASRLRGALLEDALDVAALTETETMYQNETLAEIARVHGAGFASGIEHQLRDLRGVLLPVFAASPKNMHGRLDDATARYALRRVLNEVHGWDVPELGEDDEHNDSSNQSPKLTLGRALPPAVRHVLEERTVDTGAGLLELSLFIAALQQAAVEDMHERLAVAYRLMVVDPELTVDREVAQSIVDLCVGAYICSEDLSRMTVSDRVKFQADVQYMYPVWTEARHFFREVQRLVAPNVSKFTFADVAGILRRVEKDLPFWNNRQCLVLKHRLMSMELQSSGRVRLLDFYNGALQKGMIQFRETRPYLKSLGALDESDPLEPRVIISNYLDGPSNCIGETSHYSLCCIDECGDLYTHIERHVRRPEATADELIAIVQHLSSSSMEHGRLSRAILRRLYDIAAHHDGVVPLHGQLFAEWMHYAYPRECTYPQMFGSAHAQSVREWESVAQHSGGLSEDELRNEVAELEAMEVQMMSRANAGDESDLSGTCWTWAAAEMNVTFLDEEDPAITKLPADVRGASRWAATMLFVLCFGKYAMKHIASLASLGHVKFVQRLWRP